MLRDIALLAQLGCNWLTNDDLIYFLLLKKQINKSNVCFKQVSCVESSLASAACKAVSTPRSGSPPLGCARSCGSVQRTGAKKENIHDNYNLKPARNENCQLRVWSAPARFFGI